MGYGHKFGLQIEFFGRFRLDTRVEMFTFVRRLKGIDTRRYDTNFSDRLHGGR